MISSLEIHAQDLRTLQEKLFLRQMDLVFKAHPYYREKFKILGLAQEDVKSLDDISKLPLTYKEDYSGQPDNFRLEMDRIPEASREERTLWEVVFTAGSTFKPTPFYDNSFDHYARISQLKRVAEIAGITLEDTVINLFPLTSVPHQGFLSVVYGSQAIGAKLISGFGGGYDAGFGLIRRSTEAIKMVEKHKATVLWGIGFFLRKLIIAANEKKADFSSVRLILPMGESCPKAMREDIRQRINSLGAKEVKILNGYGFTEMQSPNMECSELNGFHIPTPERYFFEILDPVTRKPLPEGRTGLVVMTHLNRRGTCLLRYVVGDICSLVSDPCPVCGGWEPRFNTIPYRTGGMVKIKGTLVSISALTELLSSFGDIQDYEIIFTQENRLDPFSDDVILIRIACEESMVSDLSRIVPDAVRQSQEVNPRVEFLPRDFYADRLRDYKFKRFRDERLGKVHGG